MAEFINVVKIQKQNLKKVYELDELDEIKIGSSDLASIILPGIAPLHLVVKSRDQKHFITEIHKNIFINSVPIKIAGKCNIELKHKDVLLLGKKFSGQVLIYKNEDADSRIQMQTFHDAAEQFGFVIPSKISKLNYEFFSKCPVGNILIFGQYLINFIYQHFNIDRAVLYKIRENGTKWKGVFARADEKTYFSPSRTLINKLRKEMKAISFDNADGDSSESIIQQSISSAFVFPMIYKNQLIAALYIDTLSEKKLSADDFSIISSLTPGCSACIRNIGYAEDELKKNKIYSDKIFSQLLEEQNNFCYANLISDTSLATYKAEGVNRYFAFTAFKGEMTSRYAVALFLKYLQSDWSDVQEDFACKELKDLLDVLPEKFAENELDITYLSIDQDKNINVSYMGNISAFLISPSNNIEKITYTEEMGDIGQVSKQVKDKECFLLFVPSKIDCSILVKKINDMAIGTRDEESIKQIIKENVGTYALFTV